MGRVACGPRARVRHQSVPSESGTFQSRSHVCDEPHVCDPHAHHPWARLARQVADLRRGATLRSQHESVEYLFQALEELTADERALFCRFAWGRSRLPVGCRDVKLIVESMGVGSPDEHLPVAHTCFFQIDLPRYSSKAACKRKLLYAIYECADMDLA